MLSTLTSVRVQHFYFCSMTSESVALTLTNVGPALLILNHDVREGGTNSN